MTMTLRTPSRDDLADFSAWRTLALSRMPYMASLLFSVRVLDAPGLGTFAVDEGHRLYIDFEQARPWGAVACGELLLHEVGHLFGEHASFARDFGVEPSERKIWNAAADASINDDLVQAGCEYIASTRIMPDQIGAPNYETAKYYLDVLRDLRDQNQSQSQSGQGQPNQDDSDQDDSGQSQSDQGGSGGRDTDGSNADGDADSDGPFTGCGSGSGGQAAPCELPEGEDFGGQAPAASAAEHRRVIVSTAAQIVEHASKGRGTVPAGLVDQARGLLEPSVTPWQRVLGSLVRRSVRFRAGQDRPDAMRRDRRRHNIVLGQSGAKVIYPGRRSPKVRVAVVRDTSGSMSAGDLDCVTSEVVAISKRLRIRGRDLTILDVDADVHTARGFAGAGSMQEVVGRGGTDMRVGIERALTLPGGVDVIVVLTDGGTPWPVEPVRVPVIAALVGEWAEQTAEVVPDWMPHLVIEDPSK
ncbi:VWA containing CoxE family protein [Pseudactinotalea sp. HY160]|uniref:vWA domain-containing protein n=1 Tax=Pseudactinotalea sp. HY160 TaxID=2654490 RepID=UPI00128BD338|nr:VWA-like domain-containing protein [Pseudactinotalea sp. HY160]MPV50047.1 VWA containing CoxE family protein [Pseudactinotalea sp. HY160]